MRGRSNWTTLASTLVSSSSNPVHHSAVACLSGLHVCNIPDHTHNHHHLNNTTHLLDHARYLYHRHALYPSLPSSQRPCVVHTTTPRHAGDSAPATDCDERRPPDHHPPTTAANLCENSTTTAGLLLLAIHPRTASLLSSHSPPPSYPPLRARLARSSTTAMTSDIPITRRSVNLRSEVERTLRTVFKRCVSCPENVNPTCPSCAKSEICSLVPSDCNNCAQMVCVRNPNPLPSGSGPNVAAIAGGVVGGIAFVTIVVFLLWRFYIKKKRAQQELEAEEWEGDDIAAQKTTHSFQAMHQDGASTRTRGSLANSMLSRMSNVIHIAYIPGVTNRNGADNSPVPPIPAARRDLARSPLADDEGALFFRPGDLRDSTYSGISDFAAHDTIRASITPSLARSSITSAIYTNNSEPMPAQQVVRAAPRMVSVKSASSTPASETPGAGSSSRPTTSGSDTTQFAANTPAGKGKPVQVMMPGQSDRSATGSVKSNASYGKAQQITLGGGKNKGRFPISREGSSSSSKHAPSVSSPLAEGGPPTSPERLRDRSPTVLSPINASPSSQPPESPFFDASETPIAPTPVPAPAPLAVRPNPYASMTSSVTRSREDRARGGGRGPGALSAVIEEATRRASEVQSIAGKRDSSPFTDAHRTD